MSARRVKGLRALDPEPLCDINASLQVSWFVSRRIDKVWLEMATKDARCKLTPAWSNRTVEQAYLEQIISAKYHVIYYGTVQSEGAQTRGLEKRGSSRA